MLTPVVSKKKSKKKKSKSMCGRELAKELILRRAVSAVTVTDVQPAKLVEGAEPKAEAVADTGLTGNFGADELSKLDVLFDILSWLICLYTGDYDKMNSIGQTIGFGQVDIAKAPQIRDSLKAQISQLSSKLESSLNSPEPLPAEAVSDIENEIKAYL